jgi:hypothetical protein
MSAWGRRCLWSPERHPQTGLDTLDLPAVLSPRPAAHSTPRFAVAPRRRGASHGDEARVSRCGDRLRRRHSGY